MKLINKMKFDKAALDKNIKTFIMHIIALKLLIKATKMSIHFLQISQITGSKTIQVVVLQKDEVFIKILLKYADHTDLFLFKLTIKLSEN